MRLIERISREMCRQYGIDPDVMMPQEQGSRIAKTWTVMQPTVVDVMKAMAKVALDELEA